MVQSRLPFTISLAILSLAFGSVTAQDPIRKRLSEIYDGKSKSTLFGRDEFPELQLKGEKLRTTNMAFSADGRLLFVGGKLYEEEKQFGGVIERTDDYIAPGAIWNLETGQLTQVLQDSTYESRGDLGIHDAVFSPDGSMVVTSHGLEGQQYNTKVTPFSKKIWSVKGGELLHKFNDRAGSHAAFSVDGKQLFHYERLSARMLSDQRQFTGNNFFDDRDDISFGLKGRVLDLESMTVKTTFSSYANMLVENASCLGPGRLLCSFSQKKLSKGALYELDLVSGKYTVLLPFPDGFSVPNEPHQMVVSTDGTLVATWHLNRDRKKFVVLVTDIAAKKELRRLEWPMKLMIEGKTTPFMNDFRFRFSPSGNQMAVFTNQGKYELWDLVTGERRSESEVGTLNAFWQHTDIALSPNGKLLADGSPFGGAVILYDLECGVPFVKLISASNPSQWYSATIDRKFCVSSSIAGPIDPQQGIVKPDHVQQMFASLYSYKDLDSVRSQKTNGGANSSATNQGRLFFLGIGVGQSRSKELQLKYPGKDMQAICDYYRGKGASDFSKVFVKNYADEKATAASIRDGLAWIRGACTPADTAVIFFAGHAIRGKKGLYYVPTDGDPTNLGFASGVNWSDIAEAISGTKAGKVLFLSDCCHAGSFGKEFFAATQQALAEEIEKRPGLLMLSASQGNEASFEDDQWQHGAFTYALLEALTQGKADSKPNDGIIDFDELKRFVVRRVPELTKDQQHPVAFPINSSSGEQE